MQLDADEDGEPFFKPQTAAPAAIQQRGDQQPTSDQPVELQSDTAQFPGQGHAQQTPAATATIEEDE